MKASARRFAANVLPFIREIQAAGIKSNAGIAEKLNERRVRPPGVDAGLIPRWRPSSLWLASEFPLS